MSVRWFLVGLLLGGCSLTGCSNRSEPETILFGYLAPPNARDKAVGEHAQHGVLLAVEEINNGEGQIPGRRIAVLHPDAVGAQDVLAPEAVRLITVNRVAALLGGQTAEEAERLGRASQTYGVAVVTPAALSAAPKGDNVFSVNVSQQFRGQSLARFAATELTVHRLILLTDARQPGYEALTAAAFKEFATNAQAQAEAWTYKTEAEFKELCDRVLKARPQAVLLAGPSADLMTLRAKLQQGEIQAPLLFGGDEDLAFQQANDKTFPDIYLALAFAGDGGTPLGQEFAKKYLQRFQEPPDLQAALAYDSIRILAEGLRRAKGTLPAGLRTELAGSNFTFESLTGPVAFTAERSARRPLFIAQVQEGHCVMLKRYDAPPP